MEENSKSPPEQWWTEEPPDETPAELYITWHKEDTGKARKIRLANGKYITLNQQQNEALDLAALWIQDRTQLFFTLSGYAGTGKAQPNTEPVLTPDGWKLMGDMEIGSLLSCPTTGMANAVINVFKHKDLKIYKVYFSDGSWTECCEDHLWQVQTPKQRINRTHYVKTLKNIMQDYEHKNSSGQWRYSIPCPEPIKFYNSKLPLHPYLLGWLLGDGYLIPSTGKEGGAVPITINAKDYKEVIELLREVLPADCRLDLKNASPTSINVRVVKIYGLYNYLKDLGILKLRSRDKFIPEIYLRGSIEERKQLLAGLMDTDGYVNALDKTKRKLKFSTFSPKLSEGFLDLVRSLGGLVSMNTNTRDKYPDGTLDYVSSLRLKFNPFKRSYKANDYGDYQPIYSLRKSIVNIEYIGQKDGRCVVVDSLEHLYITRGYTTTHNSTIAKEIIREYMNKGNGSVVVSAPTHPAKKVIANFTGLEAETLQSLLGLMPHVELADFDVNKPEFAQKKKPSIEYYKLVVVDEASMVNEGLWEMLKVQARRFNVKVLTMGDSGQLFPVKEDQLSIVFRDKDITYKYELTQVERQADGNPLMELYDSIRANLDTAADQFHKESKVVIMLKNDSTTEKVEAGYRFYPTLNQFGQAVVAAYLSDEFQLDPNHCKVVCWSNVQVEFWNQSIRKTFISHLAKQPKTSQETLLHANILMPNELLMGYASYKDGIMNAGEYEVISMQYDQRKVSYGDKKQYSTEVRGYRVALLDIDLETVLNAFIVDPELENAANFAKVFNSYLFLAKTTKAWTAYYAFKAQYLLMKNIYDRAGQLIIKKDLEYAYASTTHKMQGRTIDQVFVDMQNINQNPKIAERNRLKYVAFSRPRYLATIFTGGTP